MKIERSYLLFSVSVTMNRIKKSPEKSTLKFPETHKSPVNNTLFCYSIAVLNDRSSHKITDVNAVVKQVV